MCKLPFDNYIFDLYGTLIDIETDEGQLGLWKTMAQLYLSVGVSYTPAAMQAAYRKIWKEIEKEMKQASGMEFPEVDAVEVFRRLGAGAQNDTPRTNSNAVPLESATSASAKFVTENDAIRTSDPAASVSNEKSAGPAPAVVQAEAASSGWYQAASGNSGWYQTASGNSGWYQAAAAIFRILSRKKMRLFPHTLEALAELKRHGARIYLLSNAQQVYTLPEIQQCGLLPFFDGIMISSDEKIRKPQPEYMERLLARYQLDRTRSVMIGNEPQSDIRVAMACGMHSVLLNTWHWSRKKIAQELDVAVRAAASGERFPQEQDVAVRAAASGEIIMPEIVMSGRIEDISFLPGVSECLSF